MILLSPSLMEHKRFTPDLIDGSDLLELNMRISP